MRHKVYCQVNEVELLSPAPCKDRLLVSFTVLTRNRKDDLRDALYSILGQDYTPIEIIVVDNGSSDGTEELFQEEFRKPGIHFIKLRENRGVCGGRNVAIGAAQGDIIVTLDDDAVLENNRATNDIVDRFILDASIGVLAFKSVNYWTGGLDRAAFPCRDKSRDADEEFETSWFVGVGHAMKREVYEKVGRYRDYLPYGHEDLDLSLRVIDAGYRIVYFPIVQVRHKRASSGRLVGIAFGATTLAHRIGVAALNLPWRYVVTTAVLWTLYTLKRTRGNIPAVIIAYRDLFRRIPWLLKERQLVSKETIEKLRRLKGPLAY